MINNNSQNGSTPITTRGFAMFTIIAIVAFVVVIAGGGYLVIKKQPQTASTTQTPTAEKTLEDGTIVKSDVAMAKADGTMVKTIGTMVKPEGVVMEKKDEGAMVKPEVAMEKPAGVMVKPEGATMVKSGSYEAYSPEKIALASVKGNVVLNFSAAWCPMCRALEADINANLSNIPSNLTILKVDYDNSTDLKKKYGVTYQHTLVQVDKDGTLIKKWMGSPTLAVFVAEVK